ncbi:hypothetical protein ACJX0J_018715 [Zea mays]
MQQARIFLLNVIFIVLFLRLDTWIYTGRLALLFQKNMLNKTIQHKELHVFEYLTDAIISLQILWKGKKHFFIYFFGYGLHHLGLQDFEALFPKAPLKLLSPDQC